MQIQLVPDAFFKINSSIYLMIRSSLYLWYPSSEASSLSVEPGWLLLQVHPFRVGSGGHSSMPCTLTTRPLQEPQPLQREPPPEGGKQDPDYRARYSLVHLRIHFILVAVFCTVNRSRHEFKDLQALTGS